MREKRQKERKGTELQSKSLRQSDQTYCLPSCWEKRRSNEIEKRYGGKEAKKRKVDHRAAAAAAGGGGGAGGTITTFRLTGQSATELGLNL